jgi:hypothetical protein
MKLVYRLLFALHLFVGIGALFGGAVAVINPYKPLGVTVEALKNSPFDNYLIPGIILLVILGVGNVFSALVMRARSRFQGYISSVFSWAIMIWIVVQCIILEVVAAPHVVYFMIGAVMALLSALLLFEQRLFPANIALNILSKLKTK